MSPPFFLQGRMYGRPVELGDQNNVSGDVSGGKGADFSVIVTSAGPVSIGGLPGHRSSGTFP